MKIKTILIVFCLLYTALTAKAQCTYLSQDFDSFEFTTNDPYLVPGTVYHLAPQTWLPYTGTYAIYMNFVNNLAPGTLVYDRPYTVCPGQTYRINAWFRETWGGSSNVTLDLEDGNGTVLDTWTGVIGSASWYNHLSNPVVPTTTTLRFKLYSNWMAGSNDLTMDDLTLEMCEVAPINVINLSFCSGEPTFNLYDSLSTLVGNTGTWTGPSGTTNGFQGTLDPLTANSGAYTYTINGGTCPDSVEIVNVVVASMPDVDDIADVNACGTYALPTITGTGLTGTQSYYTAPNAGGTPMGAGTVINTTQTLYIYDGAANCFDEESFTITIDNPVNAGTDGVASICASQSTLNLFDLLGGSPDQTGNWQGSDVLSNGYLGTFDANGTTPGTYEYIVTGAGACPNDTAEVNIALQNPQLFLGNDTTLCVGDVLLLDAGAGFTNYLWQDGTTNQTYTVTTAGQYWCEVRVLGSNLIVNGDFEMGNTGFSTAYGPGVGGAWGLLSNPGTYAVTTNPALVHNNFSWCSDHTTGTGNMMVVNGSTTPNTNVWCQTVTVQPNTDYDFSTWVYSVVNGNNVALLQFSINGNSLGPIFSPSSTACIWEQFNSVWNSGANTTAQICIVNQNTGGGGNDFALDDIYFAPLCINSDTINVQYEVPPVVDLGPDTAMCVGDSVLFDAQNPGMTYTWNTGATTQTLMTYTAGTYDVTVTTPLGCSRSDTVVLITNPYPLVNLGNDTTLCDGNTLTLDATAANQTYLWNDNSTNSTLDVNTTGTYWVAVDALGCTSYDTIDVTIAPLPTVQLGNDTAFCDGNTITLDATFAGATYLWNDNSTNNTLTTGTTGTYWVNLTDNLGCEASDTIVITINPIPVVDLGADQEFCDGLSTTLNAGGNNATYLWNNNSTNSTLDVSTTGTYWVEVNELGCTASDTVMVTVHPIPVFDLGPDQDLCEDQSTTLDPGITADSYLWSTSNDQQTITVLNTPGTYSLTVTDNNCTYTDEVVINYTWMPYVDLPNDTTICQNTTLVVAPDLLHQTSMLWNDNSTETTYLAEDKGSIYVTASNICGSASDSMEVSTYLCDCLMYVPNAFTPNGDGTNDYFSAKGECQLETFVFRIYNRWGELLFESSDMNIAWGGQYLGEPVQPDVYVWRMEYTALVENQPITVTKMGHVTVVR